MKLIQICSYFIPQHSKTFIEKDLANWISGSKVMAQRLTF